ncbi:hypothetical protein J6590_016198 [Homalodisca vitripennis]|nr:hypothetical protein J6590_016198 [Homalodisca vitripennis]
MASVRKRGQTVHSEAREVISKCDEEARTGNLQHLMKQSNLQVKNYTGVSVRTISSIRKEGDAAGETPLTTPGKKRPYSEEKKFHMDDFDRRVVRDVRRGHAVLRLPPYMCELNLIELAWAKNKRVVKGNNIRGDLTLTKLEEATREAQSSVSKIDREGFTNHTLELEQHY